VYGLGQKGARVLREYGHLINHRVDWSENNKRPGNLFIAHTIEVADFLIRLELACRNSGDIGFIGEEEILALAAERTQVAREPLRWEAVSVEQGRRELWSVIPDGIFGLSFEDGSASYFMLKVDRGTFRSRTTAPIIAALRESSKPISMGGAQGGTSNNLDSSKCELRRSPTRGSECKI